MGQEHGNLGARGRQKGGKETMRCNNPIASGLNEMRQRQGGWRASLELDRFKQQASSDLLLSMGRVSADSVE